jgi:hypothetical protein
MTWLPADQGPYDRAETAAERADRNLAELLQELRVAAVGIQVLFGFLLAIPFATGFAKLSINQRHLYMATLVLAATATALLTGPVAYHRLVFRRHQKPRLVAASNAMALAGLATVGLAVNSAVWLVASFVCRGWPVVAIVLVVFLIFCVLWIVIPVAGRRPNRNPDSR